VPVFRYSVFYPAGAGDTFDHDYYRDVHIPLAVQTWQPLTVEVDKGVDGPYVAVAHFTFASHEALTAAMASEGTARIRADIPNYTTITAIRQVSEIVTH
jgi:uncharacterized protein (TIGR02118 family)